MEIVFRIIVFIVASLIILYLSRDPLSVRQIISWIFLVFSGSYLIYCDFRGV